MEPERCAVKSSVSKRQRISYEDPTNHRVIRGRAATTPATTQNMFHYSKERGQTGQHKDSDAYTKHTIDLMNFVVHLVLRLESIDQFLEAGDVRLTSGQWFFLSKQNRTHTCGSYPHNTLRVQGIALS